MDVPASIHEWAHELGRHLPLSRSQAWVLAAWSVGLALLQTCGQTRVSLLLAQLLGQKPDTVRQRLREFCYEAGAKRGAKRRAVEPEACFAGLLGWVLSLWTDRRVALALDATALKDDFVVLTLSVLLRGTALPVAWCVLPDNRPEAWRPHWLALLARVGAAVPKDYFVLVLTDRGLYAPWLFEALVAMGWHPAMRINAGGYFTPAGEAARPIAELAAQPGTHYRGRGHAFKDHPIACSLLAGWEPGHDAPWRVVTDLAPEEAQASWYGLRAWIEQGFKDFKRGGYQWQLTRMTDPARVQRFWLVLAVTALWQVSAGTADDVQAEAAPAPGPAASEPGPSAASAARRPRRRRASVFLQGAIRLLARLIRGLPGPFMRPLVPEPWPAAPPTTGRAHPRAGGLPPC